MKPSSTSYLAIEQARQGGFASHPKGTALPALGFVEAFDRAFRPALHTFPSAASGRSHVTALAGMGFRP